MSTLEDAARDINNTPDNADKLMDISFAVQQILKAIDPHFKREEVRDTPIRVARLYDEFLDGHRKEAEFDLEKGCFVQKDATGMLLVKDIPFYSLCEHHLLPFFGKVHIAYLAGGTVIGLSKLARITDMFARRLQIQERMTEQIADVVATIPDCRGVAVLSSAEHLCMAMRGVEKPGTVTEYSALRGMFVDAAALREEFYSRIQR